MAAASTHVLEAHDVRFDDIGPERIYHYYDPATQMRGVVVIDTTRFGASGGGVRMAADISLGEIARLARAMSYKYALLDMPIGGAKAGIWLDPASPTRGAVIASFRKAIKPLFDAAQFFPGADMGTSAADFAPLYGERAASGGDLGSQEVEGLPLEEQLTGYGVVMAAKSAVAWAGRSLEGARVALEGFGKAGAGAASFFAREGARVVAISTVSGALHDPEGLDVPTLLALRAQHGDAALERYPGGVKLPREALFAVPADILMPGARPDVIRAANAGEIGAKLIVPAANIPYAEGAIAALHARGIVALPDFITNAGGVLLAMVGMSGGGATEAFAAVREKIGGNIERALDAAKEREVAVYDAATALARAALGAAP